MKSCNNPNCNQINPQPLINFYKKKKHKDGIHSRCKSCIRIADNRRHRKYENSPKGKANHRRYLESPKGKTTHCIRQSKRRALKLQATPKWLTKEHHEQMRLLYIEAQRLTQENGIPYHVDHIIPLKGKEVRGLHVPWNLQVLIGSGPDGNLAKGNKVPPLTNNPI